MAGLLDFLSPKTAAEQWIAEQRSALSGDVAYQRAALAADMRRVAAEATTDAAIKFAVAGVAAFAVSFAIWRIATRRS